ncbi:MAG: transglutaminase family protein [Thiohalocapsa sp.]|jgi:transglutaminase-like putative cysteine protease
MLFTIRHHTHYRYSKSVYLKPHRLRFRPRDDGSQEIVDYRLDLTPRPAGLDDHLDLEGNRVTQAWFEQETDCLDIELSLKVRTRRHNPFNYVLAPEATRLPFDHAHETRCARAYLERIHIDDAVTAFAAELSLAANRETLRFLELLSQRLFADFNHGHREFGGPQDPAFTLLHRSGACRDLAVLFVDCCRAEGLAARFASGYQKGNLQSECRHLHAWPEVYLPGAGWRGYDPTHGEAVADAHVTIAAAADPRDSMPVTGLFVGQGATSSLNYTVEIAVAED